MAGTDARARWARVGDIFHRVLEAPVGERHRRLDELCAKDDALKREVSALLESHARDDDRLDRPPATASELVAQDAAEALVGRRVGAYDVLGLVGRGGMGVIYRALDTRLGRQVALKALSTALARDPSRRERLRREARAAAALNHPGIATVYALEEVDGQLYMASELVPGHTLRHELAAGAVPPVRAYRTLLAIAEAMAAAHTAGIVHRDLKPENVLRTPDGGIRVVDFGLARVDGPAAPARLTDDGALLGTPAYMAPEQLRGESADARADVFALGVIGYELLTGRTPFDGGHGAAVVARVLEAEPPALQPPNGLDAAATEAWEVLSRVTARCLSKAPSARPRSAAEVVAALRDRTLAAVPPETTRADGARWWWQFHLSAAAVGHAVLAVPLWFAGQLAPTAGLSVFLAGLAAAAGGSLLRLHLLFAQRSYPAEAAAQRAATRGWTRAADLLLAAACAAGGALVIRLDAGLASLLIFGAVAVVVASLIVEPATTRAAFPDQRATDPAA